jgi:hypothetical protein
MTGPLERVGQRTVAQPKSIGQVTAVEQARAVAEVAAAVQVAQQFPRDMDRVRRELQEACQSHDLASQAFYAVQNRGEGPSVHLARELATIWGNFQTGTHELHRDDQAGQSEVQAFAWDVERNSRSSRTFISPHQKMKKIGGTQTRVDLVDLTDVYLMNQNTGARALRECIFAALPKWYLNEAERMCRDTLARGTGEPVETRAAKAITAFARLNVTEAQLIARVGAPVSEWTGEDIASLEVVYRSLHRGETTVEEQFDGPTATVSAQDIIRTATNGASATDEAHADLEQKIVDDATKPGKTFGQEGKK